MMDGNTTVEAQHVQEKEDAVEDGVEANHVQEKEEVEANHVQEKEVVGAVVEANHAKEKEGVSSDGSAIEESVSSEEVKEEIKPINNNTAPVIRIPPTAPPPKAPKEEPPS